MSLRMLRRVVCVRKWRAMKALLHASVRVLRVRVSERVAEVNMDEKSSAFWRGVNRVQ